MTNSKSLYKLFGKIKKTGVTETIYVIAQSKEEAVEECSKFAEVIDNSFESERLGEDWNQIRAMFKGEHLK